MLTRSKDLNNYNTVFDRDCMVDIEYNPISKIIVHEIIRSDYQNFLNMFAIPQPPRAQRPNARWIEGILFIFKIFPPSPEVVRDKLQGILHWEIVNFTEMKDYTATVTNPKNNITMDVLDNSNNTAVSDFIRWLKNESQWSANIRAGSGV